MNPAPLPDPPADFVDPPHRVSLAEIEALPPHPRLLCDAAGWDALRRRIAAGGLAGAMFDRLRAAGDELVAATPIDFAPKGPGENVLAAIRKAEGAVLTLGALVRLTGEDRYFAAARDVLHRLAAVDWPMWHFLDPATACLTIGIGCDWLHDRLPAAERDALAARIWEAVLDPTLAHPERYSFLWGTINWNQICNAGLVVGALATADRRPAAAAQRIVNRAIAMIPRVAACYAPDGVYPEGPGYWAYGTTYHVLQLEAYRTALGDSRGLEAFPGFLGSAAALDRITGPSGRLFNFFDTFPDRPCAAAEFWFARETGRAIGGDPRLVAAARAGAVSEFPLALLWLPADDAAAADNAAAPRTSPHSTPSGNGSSSSPSAWRGRGHQPVAVLRSAAGGPGATWVAMKGGTADYSHAHMDAGTFVLEAGGVRWAIDPDIEDYLLVRRRAGLSHAQFFDYAQDSPRWRAMRLGPDGHNVLRFDGGRQRVAGHCEIGEPSATPGGGVAVEADLTSTYAGQVDAVRRRIELGPDDVVTVTDAWTTGAAARRVTWQWLTLAEVTLDPTARAATLTQDGQSVRLDLAGGPDARFVVEDASAPRDAVMDAPYPGLKRLTARCETPARTSGQFVVTVSRATNT